MKKIIMISLISLLLISCADKVEYQIDTAQHIYGFWGGVWHGMIMGPDFIGSIIWDDVSVYAINNNGFWYDFGFIGGFGFIIKIISNTAKRFKK
tara:strand:+ start:2298 stop:2579 length:282 start_codon:yes stop_codon:yes gene_type:complete